MKKYGIYLLFAPLVDLRKEGIGRLIGNFIKESHKNKNVKFVIACPFWMKSSLKELLNDFLIEESSVDIKTTNPIFIVKLFFSKFLNKKPKNKKKSKKWFSFNLNWIFDKEKKYSFIDFFYINKNYFSYIKDIFLYMLIILLSLLVFLFRFSCKKISLLKNIFNKFSFFRSMFLTIKTPLIFIKKIGKYKNIINIHELIERIIKKEGEEINKIVNKMDDVICWYCPTLFWPSVCDLNKPVLITCPDIVLTDFPVGFSVHLSPFIKYSFQRIENTIKKGIYFSTYSNDVKYNTLVKKYNKNMDDIFVIYHGSNNIKKYINFSNIKNKEENEKAYCDLNVKNLFRKNLNISDAQDVPSIKYIFYASQARPNKNMLALLKSYNYLLKKKYIQHKLIFTCHPDVLPEIRQYIENNYISRDVLFFHGVSQVELASLYYNAELSVNPSLSEGGFPFTFTESMSVGTPVVMADINVSREIITDEKIANATFFDPYDWKDMAHKIEWALNNKEDLYRIQKPLYDDLSKRTWEDVVCDHIKVMDLIGEENKIGNE